MQYIAKIIMFMLPYLIKAADKYIPEALDGLIKKIIEKKEVMKMATVLITIKNQAGATLAGANVSYTVNGLSASKKTDENGQASISGLPADTYKFTGSVAGYTPVTQTIALQENEGSALAFVLAPAITESAPVQAVEQAVGSAIDTVIKNAGITPATPVQDWDTVKKSAIDALNAMGAGVNTDATAAQLYALIDVAKTQAYEKVEDYKHQLMISRHTKDFWACVGIDIELAAIIAFEYYVAGQIAQFTAKLKEKISAE